MFTGLIQQIGQIVTITPVGAAAARLTISAPGMGSDLAIGESIAVDGACLTVESATTDSFIAYASDETLAKTTLGKIRSGKKSEPGTRPCEWAIALAATWWPVMWTQQGQLLSLEPRDEGYLLKVSAPSEILAGSVPKGSIAVDWHQPYAGRRHARFFFGCRHPADLSRNEPAMSAAPATQ